MSYLAKIAFSPADYTTVQSIINRVGTGETLTKACRMCMFPVLRFNQIVKANPELDDLYQTALQTGYDILADKLVDGDTEISNDPAILNVLSKNIQWFLTKRDKQRYGEHSVQEIHLSADKTIVSALALARQRVIDASHIEEVEYVDVTPTAPALTAQEEAELAAMLLGGEKGTGGS
jgi:hypothetical protein